MSVYDLHFNKDDVTIRNIIIGLLATLHDNISWYNQIGSKLNEKKQIKVPFYFSTTGTERYLQDNFLNNIDFDPDNLKAETFYNSIPRGIVDLTGINIEAAAIVNKYVRMYHQVQEEDGTLNTYNTEAFWVPIILNVDCKVYLDSIIDQLKCTEAIIRTFFKNKSYQVDVAYTRIPCLILFPEDYTNERGLEFSFTDKKEFTTNFSLQVKSYIPIFKPETTIFAGTTMDGFETNIGIQLPDNGSGSSGATSRNRDNSNITNSGNTQVSGKDLRGNNKNYGSFDKMPPRSGLNLKSGPIDNVPSWPIFPTSDLPPEGGTPNADPEQRT